MILDSVLAAVYLHAHKIQCKPLIRGSDWSSTTSLLRYRDDPSLFFCFFSAALWYGSILSTNLPDMIALIFPHAVYSMICIKMELLASPHKNTVPCATSTCWSYTVLGQKIDIVSPISGNTAKTVTDNYRRGYLRQPEIRYYRKTSIPFAV